MKNDATTGAFPIEYAGDESFLDAVERVHETYADLLGTAGYNFKDGADVFFDSLKLVLRYYLMGRTTEASSLFNEIMNFLTDIGRQDSPLQIATDLSLKTPMIDRDLYLADLKPGLRTYRARHVSKEDQEELKFYSPDEMFHVPFEKRGKVGNERYSISGLPCLYTGSSVYACWTEMKGPDITNFDCALVRLKKEATVFDMAALVRKYRKLASTPASLQDDRAVLLLPLALLSSFKVKKHKDVFKPEYIIPQLLMEWIIDKFHAGSTVDGKPIMGVRYYTNSRDVNFRQPGRFFINYAFPVLTMGTAGSCQRLEGFFRVESAVSGRLVQFSGDSGLNIVPQASGSPKGGKVTIRPKNGRSLSYGRTVYGVFEKLLESDLLNRHTLKDSFSPELEEDPDKTTFDGGYVLASDQYGPTVVELTPDQGQVPIAFGAPAQPGYASTASGPVPTHVDDAKVIEAGLKEACEAIADKTPGIDGDLNASRQAKGLADALGPKFVGLGATPAILGQKAFKDALTDTLKLLCADSSTPDYDLLAELVCLRLTRPPLGKGLDYATAVKAAIKAEKDDLVALSAVYLLQNALPANGFLSKALADLDGLFRGVMGESQLPESREWFARLHSLHLVKGANRPHGPKTIADLYAPRWSGFFVPGFKAGGAEHQKARQALRTAGLPSRGVLAPHPLSAMHRRLAITSPEAFTRLVALRCVGNSARYLSITLKQLKALHEVYKLCEGSATVSNESKKKTKDAFLRNWEEFPALRKVEAWWQTHCPSRVDLTPLGFLLARLYARKHIPLHRRRK